MDKLDQIRPPIMGQYNDASKILIIWHAQFALAAQFSH